MNRTQRRKTERNARRGIIYGDRVVLLPALLDEFTVFDMPQSIIDQLLNGAIDCANDVPVFRDNSGQWCEVLPALEGWLFTWRKLDEELNLHLSFYSIALISECLQKNQFIFEGYVKNAASELQRCREAFRTADRKEISRISKIAQLQILLNPTIN